MIFKCQQFKRGREIAETGHLLDSSFMQYVSLSWRCSKPKSELESKIITVYSHQLCI